MCCSNNDNQNSFSPCFTSCINHMLKLGALLMICGVWWFVHMYMNVCWIWNMHSMIILEINWQLHSMRKCKLMYHMPLIHWDFSLESQCPSACINCCFLVPLLWATKASFFRHKESVFVKWGVRLMLKCMNCIYCTVSLHCCTRTCPVSHFFFHMPFLVCEVWIK